MFARSPSEQVMEVSSAAHRNCLKETLKKVDECVRRLQELQYEASSVSPRCKKKEPLRTRNPNSRRSPEKRQANAEVRLQAPPSAMLLRETVDKIKHASQFAWAVAESASSNGQELSKGIPRTPQIERHTKKQNPKQTDLHQRRKTEKQDTLQRRQYEYHDPPSAQCIKSGISSMTSPSTTKDINNEKGRYKAIKVSPRNKPWAKKAVLFPNPLFHSSPTSMNQKLTDRKSPVTARNKENSRQLLMMSPPSASNCQMKVEGHHTSPRRSITSCLGRISPEGMAAGGLKRSFPPSKLANVLTPALKNCAEEER